MSSDIPPKPDWTHVGEEKISELGKVENWPHLRRIVEPYSGPKFAVTSPLTQASVEYVSRKLNVSLSSNGYTVVGEVLLNEKDGDGELLELILATGVDPDGVADMAKQWRPSHLCGWLGRREAAAAIFFCRPDMQATALRSTCCREWVKPEDVANRYFSDDAQHPARKPMRALIAKFLAANGFASHFPSIADLVVQKEWFAIKNLLRRQVVPANEFTDSFYGKTAEEWAEALGQESLAKEIRYYGQSIDIRVGAYADLLLTLSAKVINPETDQMQCLKTACPHCAEKDKKLDEMAETVRILSSRLDD